MPFLYLFTLKDLTCNSDQKHYAIISKKNQEKLNKLQEGDITGCFNEFGLKKDLIQNMKIISILDNTFDEIISQYKKNIKVIKNNDDYWCIIDDKKIEIIKLPYEDGNIIYNYVGIYV